MLKEASFTRSSVSSEAATELVVAAQAKAAELEMAISVCIVDDSGVMKAFGRMDGAPLVSIDLSRKKAVTAVGFGLATGQPWHDFIKDDPILMHGAPSIDNFTLLGGGSPIVVGGAVIGAIGVSGGHYSQDEACVEAALAGITGD